MTFFPCHPAWPRQVRRRLFLRLRSAVARGRVLPCLPARRSQADGLSGTRDCAVSGAASSRGPLRSVPRPTFHSAADAIASLSFCLEQELLEESPELERRSGLSVAHRWNGAVIFSVERPIHDRRGSFTARPPLALPSPWSGRRARGRRVGP